LQTPVSDCRALGQDVLDVYGREFALGAVVARGKFKTKTLRALDQLDCHLLAELFCIKSTHVD